MRTGAEIEQVLEAIREEDPAEDDEILRAYTSALEWVTGGRGSAGEFIRDYVLDAG